MAFSSDTPGSRSTGGLESGNLGDGGRIRDALIGTRVTVWGQDSSLRYTWVAHPESWFNEADVLGRTDDELMPRDLAAVVISLKRQVLRSGLRTTTRVHTAVGGGSSDYDLVVSPTYDAEGSIDGITCVSIGVDAGWTQYHYRGLRIDFGGRSVAVDEESVELTSTEFDFLARLAASPGQVVTTEDLLKSVWGVADTTVGTQLVRSMVRNTRAKIGDDPYRPRFIATKRGVGYLLLI